MNELNFIIIVLTGTLVGIFISYLMREKTEPTEDEQKKVIMDIHKNTMKQIIKAERKLKGRLVFKAEMTEQDTGRKLVIAFDEANHNARS